MFIKKGSVLTLTMKIMPTYHLVNSGIFCLADSTQLMMKLIFLNQAPVSKRNQHNE